MAVTVRDLEIALVLAREIRAASGGGGSPTLTADQLGQLFGAPTLGDAECRRIELAFEMAGVQSDPPIVDAGPGSTLRLSARTDSTAPASAPSAPRGRRRGGSRAAGQGRRRGGDPAPAAVERAEFPTVAEFARSTFDRARRRTAERRDDAAPRPDASPGLDWAAPAREDPPAQAADRDGAPPAAAATGGQLSDFDVDEPPVAGAAVVDERPSDQAVDDEVGDAGDGRAAPEVDDEARAVDAPDDALADDADAAFADGATVADEAGHAAPTFAAAGHDEHGDSAVLGLDGAGDGDAVADDGEPETAETAHDQPAAIEAVADDGEPETAETAHDETVATEAAADEAPHDSDAADEPVVAAGTPTPGPADHADRSPVDTRELAAALVAGVALPVLVTSLAGWRFGLPYFALAIVASGMLAARGGAGGRRTSVAGAIRSSPVAVGVLKVTALLTAASVVAAVLLSAVPSHRTTARRAPPRAPAASHAGAGAATVALRRVATDVVATGRAAAALSRRVPRPPPTRRAAIPASPPPAAPVQTPPAATTPAQPSATPPPTSQDSGTQGLTLVPSGGAGSSTGRR